MKDGDSAGITRNCFDDELTFLLFLIIKQLA